MVQVEDQWLEIEIIGVRATVGRTVEDEQILMPNSTLAQSTVRNLTREDELVMIRTTIPVDLTSDAELVERVLREAVESLDWVSSKADPAVILSEFTRYSIDFVVWVWIEDPSIAFHSRSKLNMALWSALNKAGVTLA
jgi:small-conductance mechanosensitive channel